MSDRDDSAFITLQMLLQPANSFGVKMIGRLIKQQDVRFLQQQPAECDATLFTAGEDAHLGISRRAAQGVHSVVKLGIKFPGIECIELILHHCLAITEFFHIGIRIGKSFVNLFKFFEQVNRFLNTLFDHFAHSLGAINQRLLLEETNAVAVGKHRLTVKVLVDPGHDPEQGRLTRAVKTEYADFGAVVVGKGNILDDFLAVVALVDAHHRVDDFFGIFAHKDNPWLKCC